MSDKSALLEKYNAARKRQGLPQFSVWTGSVEALQDAFTKLTGEVKAMNGKAGQHKTAPDKKATKAPVKADPKKVAKDNKKPDNKKPDKDDKKPAGDSVALADICARVKVEPRAARIRLRAAREEGKAPDMIGGRWAFKTKDVKSVEAIITPKS
jgi:hypothetical protein